MPKKISVELLEILACPACKEKLFYDENANELICEKSKLAFRVEEGIPVLLISEARKI